MSGELSCVLGSGLTRIDSETKSPPASCERSELLSLWLGFGFFCA